MSAKSQGTRTAFIVATVTILMGVLAPSLAAFVQEPIPAGPKHEKHSLIVHKGEKPRPTPSEGKALVYVTIGRYFGKGYQRKLSLNGSFVAVLVENQYSFFEADPGVLQLRWDREARAENYLLITALAGHTYYLSADPGSLQEVSAAEGQALIEDKKDYVTFSLKR